MIVVHIGMGKCGSSTLQEFLGTNEAALRDMSIDYPLIGRRPGRPAHHNIANEIQDRRHQRFDPKLGCLSDLVNHAKNQNFGTTVLSSEMFKNAEIDEIVRLKAAFELAEPLPEFSILLVIRDLLDFVRSRYVKRIKYGDHTYDFDEYFSDVFLKDNRDYFEIGNRWASVFGWSSIKVCVLDSRERTNGDFLDEFMALLAPDVHISAAGGLRRTLSRNVSPGWKTVEAIRALYSGATHLSENHPLLLALPKLGPQKVIGQTARKLGDQRGWNSDKGLYLTREQADICFKKYARAIESFNNRLRMKLPLPNAPDSSRVRVHSHPPSVDMISIEELEEFYDELWSRVGRAVNGNRQVQDIG